MSVISGIMLVARRELIERARSGMFIASLVITVLLVGAAIAVPALLIDETRDIGLVDPPASVPRAVEIEAERSDLDVEVTTFAGVAEAEMALAAGDVDVVVIGERTVVWQAEPEPPVDAVVTAALFGAALHPRAVELGLELSTAEALVAPVELDVRSLEVVDPDREGKRVLAMVTMIVLFMAIAMYGTFVLTGVVEEKSSRVVEVLLARIRPRHLLAGKILGIGILGLGQIVLLAAAAMITLRITGWRGPDLPPVSVGLVVWLMVWFVLGYAFYSTAYGALGALASRSEDAQTTTGPLTIVLIASYFLVFTMVTGGPDWAVRLVSLLPPTAPMAVPMRAAVGQLTWWEGAASVMLMLLAIVLLVRLAGRIYAGAALRTGAIVKLRDAWRGSD